jgi:biopolymer transport protein ExbB
MFLSELFVQITTIGADSTAQTATSTGITEVTLMDLALKGGWVMIPLAIASVMAVYIIIERIITLKKLDKDPEDFLEKIRAYVLQGDLNNATSLCQRTATPFARMIERGITKIGTPLANIEASIENVGKVEVYKLERNLSILATISGIGPMLGFFGTVTGMVSAFMAMAQVEGTVTPKLLAGGIYEALVTTVAGLVVGIIAMAGYNFLVVKVSKIIHQMEYASVEFMELLQQPNQ